MWWLMNDYQFRKLRYNLQVAQHVADNSIVMARLKTKWLLNRDYDKLIKNARKWH